MTCLSLLSGWSAARRKGRFGPQHAYHSATGATIKLSQRPPIEVSPELARMWVDNDDDNGDDNDDE